MLTTLHIENIAVIESSEIQFFPGFNVLTGETGAGKSIVIDSLGAVLGFRTSRDLIRTGAEKAFVSATFEQVDPNLSALVNNGIQIEDGTLILQRELYADGKNVCRINGRPITVAQLRELGQNLLDIHGQHDGQKLLDESSHCDYLDAYGHTNELKESYLKTYGLMSEIQAKIKSLQMNETEKNRRVDSLQFQIQELESAQLSIEEETELEEKRNLLHNSEKLLSSLSLVHYQLNGDEDTSGAVEGLQHAMNALNPIRHLTSQFSELYDRLKEQYLEVSDVAETVADIKDSYDFSPQELNAVEERFDQIYRLKKKYGNSVEEMLTYLDECKKELETICSSTEEIQRLEGVLSKAKKQAEEDALMLSEARKASAKVLEDRIQSELADLDMPKVRFHVDIQKTELCANGIDEVQFFMSANVGEDLKPIHKIASGGELARIMLALKNVLSESDEIGTLVFDEVDTGVSGRAAQKVAEKIAQVSRKKQVLCVTHLPQIAAMADTHFVVRKSVHDSRTFTDVNELNREERKSELSRITGSGTLSEALLKSSEELLNAAENYRKGLQ